MPAGRPTWPLTRTPETRSRCTERAKRANSTTTTATAAATMIRPTTDPGPIALGGSEGFPTVSWPITQPVRHEPRLLTRPDEVKPPYPESKILSEQEATLQLRLTINDSGRVTAVDPIGAADGVFLEAARRYLIAHWRYQPATEDGRAIGSSVVISLHFQLDG